MSEPDVVAAFAARECVSRALAQPRSTVSVLSFMFGTDFLDQAAVRRSMHDGHSVLEMRALWFATRPAYDQLCHRFIDVVRASGRRQLSGTEWRASVDGLMAQLVLCDQLARSIFRGTHEAFAYDARSLELARTLAANLLEDNSRGEDGLEGVFYPPYLVFLQTAFMHSESPDDHVQLRRIVDYADVHAPPLLHDWFALMRRGGAAHTAVVDRFGRYPHRNAAKGRANTPDEAAWLADVDNLPSWARSQLPASNR